MRRFAALPSALLLAAAAAPAYAKPPSGPDDPGRAMYRLQAVGACVAAHPPGRVFDPQDARILDDCQCAVDRFIAGRDLAGLPRLIPGEDKGLLDGPFAECRAERNRAAPVPAAPWDAPADAADAPNGGTSAAPPPAAGSQAPAFDPFRWLQGIDVPRWAWAAIPVLALLLFAMLRRRSGRGDLIAPPRSLGRGARAAPLRPPSWPEDRSP